MISRRAKWWLAGTGVWLIALAYTSQSDDPLKGHPDRAFAWSQQRAAEDINALDYEEVAGGFRCTDDCSGHIAGFEWAKRNEISDEDDCANDSPSFTEGCAAFASEYEDRILQRELESLRME